MSRLHIHIAADDLQHNINFYSAQFGASPTVVKTDYAKSYKYWTVDPQGIAWEAFHTLGEARCSAQRNPSLQGPPVAHRHFPAAVRRPT